MAMQASLFGAMIETPQAPSAETELSLPFEDALITVYDLETTGLQARRNAITEITAIQYKAGAEVDRFSSLVKPNESIPEEVTAITGITDAMVANAPAPIMALSDLCRLVGETPLLVGHNVSFDVGFVRAKLEEVGLDAYLERFVMERALCTKVLAQKVLPGLPTYEGIAVAHQFGIVNPNPHRAEYDVKMTAELVYALVKRLQETNPEIKTVEDVIAFQNS